MTKILFLSTIFLSIFSNVAEAGHAQECSDANKYLQCSEKDGTVIYPATVNPEFCDQTDCVLCESIDYAPSVPSGAIVTCSHGQNDPNDDRRLSGDCNAGYWKNGNGTKDVCEPCATSGNSANAATVTCTNSTNQVATTCDAGYGLVGNACGACAGGTYAVQGNSAMCQTCASGSYTDTGTGTTGTTCSTCATSGNGANAATVTCTTGTDQIATSCATDNVLLGDACHTCSDTKAAYHAATCSCSN